jgi:hypothetical protein
MCVVIAKPVGSKLSISTLKRCWDSNNQGAGVSWCDRGEIFIEKGFMEWDSFKGFWESRDWTKIPAIIHFRIATHGGINEENTHPFWVFPSQLAFAHNGIMDFTREFDHISDTQVFNRYVLKQLPRNFLSNSGIRLMMEDYIGQSNKLVFLNREGQLSIINEGGGNWEGNGCWFSNSFWKMTYSRSGWVYEDEVERSAFYDPDNYYKDENNTAYSGEDRDHDPEREWEKFKEEEAAEEEKDLEDFIPYHPGELPPFLEYDRFYCYQCRTDFSWLESDRWYRKDGHQYPECPICLSPETTFGIGKDGIWVEGKHVRGQLNEDEINEYLDHYGYDTEIGGEDA